MSFGITYDMARLLSDRELFGSVLLLLPPLPEIPGALAEAPGGASTDTGGMSG